MMIRPLLMSPPTSGYSGTPLAKKLGIVEACHVVAIQAPGNYLELLAPLPANIVFANRVSKHTDIVHLFSVEKKSLQVKLEALRVAIKANAAIWVSWPKKASKVPTDITEDTIREIALPLGLVDIKVCAVSEIWSGLKLVIRKELR
jgi:hypothetical protein